MIYVKNSRVPYGPQRIYGRLRPEITLPGGARRESAELKNSRVPYGPQRIYGRLRPEITLPDWGQEGVCGTEIGGDVNVRTS